LAGNLGGRTGAAGLREQLAAGRCQPVYTKLVEDALETAILRRVVLHSDQGTQYNSLAFGIRLREANILPSMGSRGDAYDNSTKAGKGHLTFCQVIDGSRD